MDDLECDECGADESIMGFGRIGDRVLCQECLDDLGAFVDMIEGPDDRDDVDDGMPGEDDW